jgi:hypothetical protein
MSSKLSLRENWNVMTGYGFLQMKKNKFNSSEALQYKLAIVEIIVVNLCAIIQGGGGVFFGNCLGVFGRPVSSSILMIGG